MVVWRAGGGARAAWLLGSLLCVLWAGPTRARLRRSASAPTAFVCPKGRTSHVACSCSATFVRCVNTQLRDAEIFQDIAARFPRIKEVSVNGNSLMGLRSAIFATAGQRQLRHLHKLLIPNNYLVELTPDVFKYAPNLHTLDLSFNEIKLAPERKGFLKPIGRLRHLILRKGFSRPLKYDPESTSRQLILLEDEFRAANLSELFHLDLSTNFLRYVPLGFGCSLLGVLKKLSLEGNELRVLSPANMSCLFELEELNLSRNFLGDLVPETRVALGAFQPATVLLAGNKLCCDCGVTEAVAWLRENQSSLRDADELLCDRRSPAEAVGRPALSLPPGAFVCSAAPLPTPPLLPLLLLSAVAFAASADPL